MATYSAKSYQFGDHGTRALVERFERQARARADRAFVIERFVNRERARAQKRFFEFSVMAALYAKQRAGDDLDAAYRELLTSLDDKGFLHTRVLYLHPDVSPPYLPPVGPGKKPPPLITRDFIESRIRALGFETTRDAYLARCWIYASRAVRWLNSHGIAAPGLVDTSAGAQPNKQSDKQDSAPKSPSRRSGSSPTNELPRRPRGPNPAKTRAATEKLRSMLRSGEITPAQLTKPIGEGGLKQKHIADLLNVRSRTTAKKIVALVLPEFVPPPER